jgi:O-antigen/teichoic acid export membrane protein
VLRFSAASTADRFLPAAVAARLRPLAQRLDAVLFSMDERGHSGRASLAAFAIRIVSAAIAFVSQVLMARWMGGFEYGVFVLVWTVMVMVGDNSCFGFQTSVVRFIPQYRERGERGELRGLMRAAQGFVLVASCLVAATGLLGVWLLSDTIENYYVLPFYLGLSCLPLIALSTLMEGMARANGWSVVALTPVYILRPILILAMMAGAVLLDFAPSARVAIVCAIVASFLTTLYQLIAVVPPITADLRDAEARFRPREWIMVSLPIFLVDGFFYLHTNADLLMVGWFMEPQAVAIYFATLKLLALVHFVYFAVKAGVAQRYAQYAHSGDRARLASFARETVGWTFWPSLAMAVVIVIIGKPLLMLFGPGFETGYPLLLMLLAGVVVRAFIGPAESLLTMSGHQKICAGIFAATLAVNVGLNLLLIPRHGLWGAAVSSATAMIIETLLLGIAVRRTLGITMIVSLGGKNTKEVLS